MCGNCGKLLINETTYVIYKQVGGEWLKLYVCEDCLREYQRELAQTRENFRRQFGEK